MDLIRGANPYPGTLPPLPIEPIMRRLSEDRSLQPGARRRVRLPSVGGIIAAVSVVMALAIAVLAIGLLGHRQAATTHPIPPAATQPSTAGTSATSYSVMSQPVTTNPVPSQAIPARQLHALIANNKPVVDQAHLVDLPNGYQGWIMPDATGHPGAVCVAFVRPGDLPGINFCAESAPGADGAAVTGGGEAGWSIDGIEPDAATQVRITLAGGATQDAPVISNMFVARGPGAASSYTALNAQGHPLSSQTFPNAAVTGSATPETAARRHQHPSR
jgi:hypothetical protein